MTPRLPRTQSGWRLGQQNHTGYVAHFSEHITENYNGHIIPKWMIVKEPQGYMLYTFMYGGYHRLTGFQPHKKLKDVKNYCDVQVPRFERGDY